MLERRLACAIVFLGALSLALPVSAQINTPNISITPGGGSQPTVAGNASSQGVLTAQPGQSAGQNAGGAGGGGDGSVNRDLISGVSTFTDTSDPSAAFFGVNLPVQRLYRGVIPGLRDTLPHIRGAQLSGLKNRGNTLSWIGFQRQRDKTRIFLQTFDVPAFEIVRGKKAGELIVVLRDTKVCHSNFFRNIDARWIPRSISNVDARRVGRDIHVSIFLRRQVEFSVSVDGKYINVDFSDAFLEPDAEAPAQLDDPDNNNGLRDPDA